MPSAISFSVWILCRASPGVAQGNGGLATEAAASLEVQGSMRFPTTIHVLVPVPSPGDQEAIAPPTPGILRRHRSTRQDFLPVHRRSGGGPGVVNARRVSASHDAETVPAAFSRTIKLTTRYIWAQNFLSRSAVRTYDFSVRKRFGLIAVMGRHTQDPKTRAHRNFGPACQTPWVSALRVSATPQSLRHRQAKSRANSSAPTILRQ